MTWPVWTYALIAAWWGLTLGLPLLRSLLFRRRFPIWAAYLVQAQVAFALGVALFGGEVWFYLGLPPVGALFASLWSLRLAAEGGPIVLAVGIAGVTSLIVLAMVADRLTPRFGPWALFPVLVLSLAAMIGTAEWRAARLIAAEATRLEAECLVRQSFIASLRQMDRAGHRRPHATALIGDVPMSWSYRARAFRPVTEGSLLLGLPGHWEGCGAARR